MNWQDVGLKKFEYDTLLKILGREPLELELHMIGVMWSEHCSYKSTRALLKDLPQEGEAVVHGPGENAGVVDIGDGYGLVFKVESHNHPSAVAPYQGAATGVGGIIRDILAMGARPVASMDGLCFGDPDYPKTPALSAGIVSGIGGYGNAVGVPTVGGLTIYDPCYNENPLVNAFCAGIVRLDAMMSSKTAYPGLTVLVLGSKTGRDGIAGASFASRELAEDANASRPQIQIGDPFEEKLLIEACLDLINQNLVVCMQDMGAAGLLSSSSEVAYKSNVGIIIHADKIPLRESDMQPWEIFLSESQERMLLVVEPNKETRVHQLAQHYGLDCAAVGEIVPGNQYRVLFHNREICNLPASILGGDAPLANWASEEPPDFFLTEKSFPLPTAHLKEGDVQRKKQSPILKTKPDISQIVPVLQDLLAAPDLSDHRWIYVQYDSMVQTNTVAGPGNPVAILRIKDSQTLIAFSMKAHPWICMLDPYHGTAEVVASCLRKLWVAGAKPLGLTNCLNFPSPEVPTQYWELSQSIRGMGDACRQLDCPVVSGNVSLYNEAATGRILPTPLVVAAGKIESYSSFLRADSFRENDLIFLAGNPDAKLDGSLYGRRTFGLAGKPAPFDLDAETAFRTRAMETARLGYASGGWAIGKGGLACSLVLAARASNCGVRLNYSPEGRKDAFFFGEGGARSLYSVPKQHADAFLTLWKGVAVHQIGEIIPEPLFVCNNEQPMKI